MKNRANEGIGERTRRLIADLEKQLPQRHEQPPEPPLKPKGKRGARVERKA
jgi:hypothetical protein